MQNWLDDLMREAAALALQYRRDGFEITIKPDGSPVTSADLAVHALFVERIRARFPEDCILSEEGADPEAVRTQARRAWLIDPIDGTKLFIDGHADYSILVGLWEEGRMVASAAAWPEHNLFLYARRGHGCLVNGHPATISSRRFEEARLQGYGAPFRALTNIPRPEVSGARAIVRILQGELDGGLMLISPTWGEHDIAFAVCALEEAGGKVSDGNGRHLRLNAQPRVRPRTILASNGVIHGDLVDLARELDS